MIRRSVVRCVCILCACLFFVSASAEELPTRNKFSLAYARLSESIAKGRPVRWSIVVEPNAMADDAATDALARLLGPLEFSGLIQCFLEGGGRLDALILDEGEEIASLGQLARDGRVSVRMGDEWVSMGDGAQGLAMLAVDALGESLLSIDYSSVKKGSVPFLTPMLGSAMHLWELASPWSDDNNYLQVSKGSTSHGTTYRIDTAGLQTILAGWADSLPRDAFFFGIPGTDFSIGMEEETFDGLVSRLRQLAQVAEMSEQLKINMVFGEGDYLASAKGSGTIRTSGGSKGISYEYTASQDAKKASSRQRVNFQPAGSADTIVLDLKKSTSSNDKDSAVHAVNASVQGLFDAKPYTIDVQVDMDNGYAASDGLLAEVIRGNVGFSLRYDGATVADVAITREAITKSYSARNELYIEETLYIVVQSGEDTVFSGTVAITFEIDETEEALPAESSVRPVEAMDFMEIEVLRGALNQMLEDARARLAEILPGGGPMKRSQAK